VTQFQRDGWSEASGKAMMFARALCDYQIFLVSALDRETLSSIHLQKVGSVSEAWQRARSDQGPTLKTAVIPRAAGLIPAQAREPHTTS
jgi:hypothetical protein